MANFILVPGSENSYYYDVTVSSIGLYNVGDNKVVLFDSGINEKAAKEINKTLKKRGWIPIAIINTHHHADHCGGNAYFQKEYSGLPVYATEREKIFIQYPDMQPTCFCNGAFPLTELCINALQPAASIVTHEITPYRDQSIQIQGVPFTIVTLPGHTPGMIGIITTDNVLYCGDAFFGPETFAKHGVLFYTNIQATLDSLKKLKTLPVASCVYYHGGLCSEEMSEAIDRHSEKLQQTARDILNIIKRENHVSLEAITEEVMRTYHAPANMMSYTLTQTAVNAYVRYLEDQADISVEVTPDKQRMVCLFPTGTSSEHSDETSARATLS